LRFRALKSETSILGLTWDNYTRELVDRAAWEAFGEWIEGLRKRAGLQVRDLAERAGVSAQWLQELRHGGRAVYGSWRLPNPKDEALARLARALDVPVEEMFARAGRQPAAPGDREDQGTAAASDAARIQELEERVAQQQRELAELRRLLEERSKQAEAR
jgi:transcriptional regulator with XRE-family HTH domain